MRLNNFDNIISRFPQAKILVIGDLILDQYIWGDVDRVSPEAPVPVVWAKKRTYVPGGAANVANNIASLGGKVCLCGVVGDERYPTTMKFREELKKCGVDTSGVFAEKGRETILKTRIIAGHQQVVRVDWEDANSIKKETADKLQGFIKANIKKFDACIIEDYGKGLLDAALLHLITSLAHKHKKIVTVDPKEDNFKYYEMATCITPNRKETQNAVRYLKMKDQKNKFRIYDDKLLTDHDIDSAGKMIVDYLKLDSLLITLGEHGMRLFENNGKITNIPTVAQEVFDVSGAGDTVIATFTLALSAQASKADAAKIANFAAGIVVGKIGTATITREELSERINNYQ